MYFFCVEVFTCPPSADMLLSLNPAYIPTMLIT